MNLIPWLWIAGVVQLLIASANFFAPRLLHYRENLAKVSPMVREVFIVQNAYIVLVLLGNAGLCFCFTEELAGDSLLGRSLSGFLALFWGMRLPIQLFFYDPEAKRRYPVFNLLFLLAFVYLTGVFAVAVLGLAR